MGNVSHVSLSAKKSAIINNLKKKIKKKSDLGSRSETRPENQVGGTLKKDRVEL